MSRIGAVLLAVLAAVPVWFLISTVTNGSQETTQIDLTPRFQISAWGAADTRTGKVEQGAYIINTNTGDVWSIGGNREPQKIGIVK